MMRLLALCCLVMATPTRMTSGQEKPAAAQDAELTKVKEMIRQAWQESDQFAKAGGKDTDENHPNRKWSELLWQYRLSHPGTPAAAKATSEALHLLIHADRSQEASDKISTLKADDPAWMSVIGVMQEAAITTKRYGFLIEKLNWLLRNSLDPQVKARAQFAVGEGYWESGRVNEAKKAFQRVLADHPASPYAKEAEGNLYEIDFLNAGRPRSLPTALQLATLCRSPTTAGESCSWFFGRPGERSAWGRFPF